MVTRRETPLGFGIVRRSARTTPRPNSSFSPERVMFGGRPTDASRPVPKTGKSGGLSFSAELDAECRWEGPLPDPAAVSGSGNAASA